MKKVFVLALSLALVGTNAAFAHAHLLSEKPADKATVSTAPTVLMLKFSEGVALGFTGVKVTGPGMTVIATGTGSLDPKEDSLLTIPVSGKLAAGLYTVAWHALSTDGHKTSGTYSFTVK
jgi:copper resistance protein C